MTPRSERSSSSLLGGGTSPASPVQEHLMGVAEREEEEEDEDVPSLNCDSRYLNGNCYNLIFLASRLYSI